MWRNIRLHCSKKSIDGAGLHKLYINRIRKLLMSSLPFAVSCTSEFAFSNNLLAFEPMIMSILLGHQKRLRELEDELSVFDKPNVEPNKETKP
jgi:hypothetical protein